MLNLLSTNVIMNPTPKEKEKPKVQEQHQSKIKTFKKNNHTQPHPTATPAHALYPTQSPTTTPTALPTATHTVPIPPPPPNPLRLAPFAPGDPIITQSLHAACISTTNACPSGDCEPLDDQSSGLTTGVSQPLVSICMCCVCVVWYKRRNKQTEFMI